MKFALPRGQKRFLIIVGVIFLLYQSYHVWTHRDITWRWKEEVQLADGSRVWVERVDVREVKGGGEPFKGLMRGSKITRIHIPDSLGDLVWESTLAPMILERGSPPARWVVIASPVWCEDHTRYGSPKPPYIQFEYIDGLWMPKQVDPKWYDRKSNLSMNEEQQAKHAGQSLTAEQVRKFNDRVYGIGKDYLAVDANYKSNCYR